MNNCPHTSRGSSDRSEPVVVVVVIVIGIVVSIVVVIVVNVIYAVDVAFV